jgi:hypothetical protein
LCFSIIMSEHSASTAGNNALATAIALRKVASHVGHGISHPLLLACIKHGCGNGAKPLVEALAGTAEHRACEDAFAAGVLLGAYGHVKNLQRYLLTARRFMRQRGEDNPLLEACCCAAILLNSALPVLKNLHCAVCAPRGLQLLAVHTLRRGRGRAAGKAGKAGKASRCS